MDIIWIHITYFINLKIFSNACHFKNLNIYLSFFNLELISLGILYNPVISTYHNVLMVHLGVAFKLAAGTKNLLALEKDFGMVILVM